MYNIYIYILCIYILCIYIYIMYHILPPNQIVVWLVKLAITHVQWVTGDPTYSQGIGKSFWRETHQTSLCSPWLPSGKHTKNVGKSPCSMIHYKRSFSIAMLNYRSVAKCFLSTQFGRRLTMITPWIGRDLLQTWAGHIPICSMVLEYLPTFALKITQFCR